MPEKRIAIVLVLLLLKPFIAVGADEPEDAVWEALKSGRHVVLIRHAITEPGIGDPPGFRVDDCSTQRNLSAEGRRDATRIGEAFRNRAIPVSEVLSSRWCRCIDTARLAFGTVTPVSMLDSMFNDKERPAEEKRREVFERVERRPATGNLVLVTHNRNILALTGISPVSGEIVVVTPDGPGRFRLIGRIASLVN
ncbi:MAG TPA: histidine phosphatase family protein [Noviherbaspirillum sp.]